VTTGADCDAFLSVGIVNSSSTRSLAGWPSRCSLPCAPASTAIVRVKMMKFVMIVSFM